MPRKKLLLYCFFINLFLLDGVQAALGEEYFKPKKYAFSQPILNETTAFFAIAGPRSSLSIDEANEVFLRMWEEALRGNEQVQTKLFRLFTDPRFLETAKTRATLLQDVTTYSLDILIDIAIAQDKPWAFYEKALKETDLRKKFILINQARNNLLEGELASKAFKEYNNLAQNFPRNIPKGKNHTTYINYYKELKAGSLLYYLYQQNKNSNPELASAYFQASLEVGYFEACRDQAIKYHSINDKENASIWFLKTAQKINSPDAWFNAGNYLVNSGRINEGIEWLLKASEEGSCDAMYIAAEALSKDFDNPDSQTKYFSLIQQAADLGHLKATKKYAQMLMKGFAGNNPDLAKAADLFFKIINAKEYSDEENFENKIKPKAMYYYGTLIKMGFHGQQANKNKALDWIIKAANNGCTAAMNYYGAYLMGWIDTDVEINTSAAFKWFFKAAKNNDSASMLNMGELLWFGTKKVKQDHKAAKKWLSKSMEKGNLDAMLFLSNHLLAEALKVGLSAEDSDRLHKESAHLKYKLVESNYFNYRLQLDNNSNATLGNKLNVSKIRYKYEPKQEMIVRDLINLAVQCDDGYLDGAEKSQKIFELILAAAKNNYPAAMHYLGIKYLTGVKLKKPNEEKALKWFRRAAENGHIPSMVKFGSLILDSNILSQDQQSLSDAFFWLQKAKSLGNKDVEQYFQMAEALLKKGSEKIEISDKEISDFCMTNEVSNSNNSIQLIIIDSFENSVIAANTDENSKKEQPDDSSVDIDFSTQTTADCGHAQRESFFQDVSLPSNNTKSQKENLCKLGKLKRSYETKVTKIIPLELSSNNQSTVDKLLDKKTKYKKIDFSDLSNLFMDPFFEGQVSIIKSKSGCVITAKNFRTLDYFVASTHKKHNKTYDGLNPFFARDLNKILSLFGLVKS